MSERLNVVSLRAAPLAGPTDEHWRQAQLRADKAGAKFVMLICEDGDGKVSVIGVNIDSDVHLRALADMAPELFEEDE